MANLFLGLSQPFEVVDYWKSKATIWQQLCGMAKDVVAVYALWVGVERLFDMAQDVLHYCQGHLKSETISSLMMMGGKDSRKLEKEVENHDAADWDKFDNN